MNPYGSGAYESPTDIRTFAYVPSGAPQKEGTRYLPQDIEHQHTVGICTAADQVQNAEKALGKKFSIEFQYLIQKLDYDQFSPIGWEEGSSCLVANKVAKNTGLLPAEYWTWTTEEDRKLPYAQYIAKLRAVPAKDIERLRTLAAPYKLTGYAQVTPLTLDNLKNAIAESRAGVICRFDLGEEWWTAPIEPLRAPKNSISGHSATISNSDGTSFRIANEWGKDWADNGTAYFLWSQYRPTEAWIPYYTEAPDYIVEKLQQRVSLLGKLANALQTLIELKRAILNKGGGQ